MIEKILLVSDIHVPDHNKHAYKIFLNVLADHAPDYLFINGDFLNFAQISRFDQIEDYSVTLGDEIEEGKRVLTEIVQIARTVNPKVTIYYVGGNHEIRITKYLFKNARALKSIREDNNDILSVRFLLHLDQLGVKWVDFYDYVSYKGVIIEHGHSPRAKAGYTAHARLLKRMRSGFSGDTHRLAHVHARYGEKEYWWIETGCLQNYDATPRYIHKGDADWQNGFVIANIDGNQWYPQLVPIINGKAHVLGKTYG